MFVRTFVTTSVPKAKNEIDFIHQSCLRAFKLTKSNGRQVVVVGSADSFLHGAEELATFVEEIGIPSVAVCIPRREFRRQIDQREHMLKITEILSESDTYHRRVEETSEGSRVFVHDAFFRDERDKYRYGTRELMKFRLENTVCALLSMWGRSCNTRRIATYLEFSPGKENLYLIDPKLQQADDDYTSLVIPADRRSFVYRVLSAFLSPSLASALTYKLGFRTDPVDNFVEAIRAHLESRLASGVHSWAGHILDFRGTTFAPYASPEETRSDLDYFSGILRRVLGARGAEPMGPDEWKDVWDRYHTIGNNLLATNTLLDCERTLRYPESLIPAVESISAALHAIPDDVTAIVPFEYMHAVVERMTLDGFPKQPVRFEPVLDGDEVWLDGPHMSTIEKFFGTTKFVERTKQKCIEDAFTQLRCNPLAKEALLLSVPSS